MEAGGQLPVEVQHALDAEGATGALLLAGQLLRAGALHGLLQQDSLMLPSAS